MHPYHQRLIGCNFTLGEGKMQTATDGILVGMDVELTELGFHLGARDFGNRVLVGYSVVNQINNSANLDLVLFSKLLQIGASSHRSVFIHNLDDCGRRRVACQTREVAARLGMTGSA